MGGDEDGEVEAEIEVGAETNEGNVDNDACDAEFFDERELLFRLFNLANWRAQHLRLISPFHCHSL